MTRLVPVKHSVPRIDPSLPAREWALSREGKRRCRWLARELDRLGVAVLCSSVEAKARQTAEIVGRHLKVVPHVGDGLHENDRTGFPYIPDEREWERRLRAFFDQPTALVIGRETASATAARFSRAVAAVVAEHPRDDVGVIAHGAVIALFVARHNRVAALPTWRALNPLPAYASCRVPGYELEGPPRGFAREGAFARVGSGRARAR